MDLMIILSFLPLQINVQGIEKTIIGTKNGEYWRLLVPGTYTVTASAPGFQPVTKPVSVGASEPPAPSILHFQLQDANSAQAQAQPQPLFFNNGGVQVVPNTFILAPGARRFQK